MNATNLSILDNNRAEKQTVKKPIDIVIDDLKQIQNDLSHIKNYIRKLEIREQLQEDKDKKECVVESRGWWFN